MIQSQVGTEYLAGHAKSARSARSVATRALPVSHNSINVISVSVSEKGGAVSLRPRTNTGSDNGYVASQLVIAPVKAAFDLLVALLYPYPQAVEPYLRGTRRDRSLSPNPSA